MIKKKKLIVANWKMNPSELSKAKKIFTGIKKTASKLLNVQTVVCPPFIYLEEVISMYKGHRISFGAQNVFEKNKGSFTGMISPEMLKKNKVEYVILGHSERRVLGETDEQINEKVRISLKTGLKVFLCIGESERDANAWHFPFVKDQLLRALEGVTKKDLENIAIAYEPIWAISNNSKGKAMSPESIQEMTIFIKKVLSDKYGVNTKLPKILYGGSVNSKNTEDIIIRGGVDGLLIGRASLDPIQFGEILKTANRL